MKTRLTGWLLVVLLIFASSPALAAPNLLQYQGRLTNAAGDPQNGTFSIVFSVYAAVSGGAALYSETIPNVTVTNGLFNVLIGNITPIPTDLFGGGAKFLGIKVGGDAEMTPRQAVASVPFALQATFAQAIPWALIKADGSIVRQSGGITVSHTGTGIYVVDTPANENNTGFMSTSYNSPGAGISFCTVTAFTNGTGWNVRVYDSAGAPVDHDFGVLLPASGGSILAPQAAPSGMLVKIDPKTNLPIQ